MIFCSFKNDNFLYPNFNNNLCKQYFIRVEIERKFLRYRFFYLFFIISELKKIIFFRKYYCAKLMFFYKNVVYYKRKLNYKMFLNMKYVILDKKGPNFVLRYFLKNFIDFFKKKVSFYFNFLDIDTLNLNLKDFLLKRENFFFRLIDQNNSHFYVSSRLINVSLDPKIKLNSFFFNFGLGQNFLMLKNNIPNFGKNFFFSSYSLEDFYKYGFFQKLKLKFFKKFGVFKFNLRFIKNDKRLRFNRKYLNDSNIYFRMNFRNVINTLSLNNNFFNYLKFVFLFNKKTSFLNLSNYHNNFFFFYFFYVDKSSFYYKMNYRDFFFYNEKYFVFFFFKIINVINSKFFFNYKFNGFSMLYLKEFDFFFKFFLNSKFFDNYFFFKLKFTNFSMFNSFKRSMVLNFFFFKSKNLLLNEFVFNNIKKCNSFLNNCNYMYMYIFFFLRKKKIYIEFF